MGIRRVCDQTRGWIGHAGASNEHRRGLETFYAKLTCSACRPLGPRVTTNDTFAPSSSER